MEIISCISISYTWFYVYAINIYKTLTSVPSRGREGAWRKNKKGGGLAIPERASDFNKGVDHALTSNESILYQIINPLEQIDRGNLAKIFNRIFVW